MCGISGFIDRTFRLGEEQLLLYNKVLLHRGPDAQDYYLDKIEEAAVGLAHVRLSILDLSDAGKQPMHFQNLTIIYNGEIFNFKEIKNDLLALGYDFHSDSDTEVILKSFHAWGTDCVHKFRGMFAFVIYDNITKKLYLCRDRAGLKPLYYFLDDNQFIFGSELKVFFSTSTFSPQVDIDSLKTFLHYGYVTNNKTILKGVYKVNPGEWMEFDLSDFSFKTKKYWSFASFFEKEKFRGTFEDAVEETERIVSDACEYRMVSDVPVGIFLSGGFDSTLVTTLLQKDRTEKLKTFTIGFSDGVDESRHAIKIAQYLGTDHVSYDCTKKDALNLIPLLPQLYDDPIADISCIPTLLVSIMARQEVKVALSADGGDELFGGYNGFSTFPPLLEKLNKIPFPGLIGAVATASSSFFKGDLNNVSKKLKGLGQILTSNEEKVYLLLKNSWGLPNEITENLLKGKGDIDHHHREKLAFTDSLDELFVLGFDDVLANLLLVKVDRATMGVSLEGREPLLDHKIAEFSAQLPFKYKHNGVQSKRPLRQIVYKYIPKELMDRPKTGFDLPIYKWLNEDLAYLFDEFLSAEKIQKAGIFSAEYVAHLIKLFKQNKLRYKSIIWNLLIFQMWYDRWIEKNV